MAGQVTGRDAVLSALQNGQELDMVLVDREKDTTLIRQLCEERGILLQEGSAMICGECLTMALKMLWH